MKNTRIQDSTWPEYEYQINVGSYGGTDDRFKRRKRKQPIGFVHPPKPKPTRRKPK